MRRIFRSLILWIVPFACPARLGDAAGHRSKWHGQRFEWRSYGADPANTRYSPLDQINAGNFKNLEIAWRFKTDNLGPRPEFNSRSRRRSMANGVLILDGRARGVRSSRSTPQPASCCGCTARTKARAAQARRACLSGRGLAYWTDGREERILYVTPGYRLIALNAKTGSPGRRIRVRTASSI